MQAAKAVVESSGPIQEEFEAFKKNPAIAGARNLTLARAGVDAQTVRGSPSRERRGIHSGPPQGSLA